VFGCNQNDCFEGANGHFPRLDSVWLPIFNQHKQLLSAQFEIYQNAIFQMAASVLANSHLHNSQKSPTNHYFIDVASCRSVWQLELDFSLNAHFLKWPLI